MAFSPEAFGALKRWIKQYVNQIIGVSGIKIGTVSNESTGFPIARFDGSPLHIEDYVEVAPGSRFPFTINEITFNTKFDRAVWSGITWGFSAGSIVESGEVSISDKTTESISGLVNNQSEVNVELINNIKNFPAYENLSELLPAQITTRVYRQTTDTQERKAGLYWYNANSFNVDKWEALGGGGIDYTEKVKTNTYNATNLIFSNDFSAIKSGDNLIMSGRITLKTPMTDYLNGNTRRKVMEIPECAKSRVIYLYVTTTGGTLTCEEDRHDFYDSDGKNYVDPNGRFDVQVYQLAAVRRQNDDQGTLLYYYVKQSVSTEGYMLEETDQGTPKFKKTTAIVNNKIATTIYRVITDPGYIGVGSEEEEWQSDQIDSETGEHKKTNIYVDVPCYKVLASEIIGNSDYMYKAKLAELGCFVDSQGRVGKYEFTPDIQFNDIMADTSSKGFAGICRFVVENVTPKNQMRELQISPKNGSTEIGELTLSGDIPVTSIDLAGAF